MSDPRPAPVDGPAAVRRGEELPVEALSTWWERETSEPAGPIEVRQFPGGFSNLTYLVTIGGRQVVLRRPPVGSEVKGAHDVLREHRLLTALAGRYPVPRPVAACAADSVIGAPFYLMERVPGVILRRDPPPGLNLDPEACRRLGDAFVERLADLHALDPEAVGLGDLGRPEGYVRRQVDGWSDRWRAAETDDRPDAEGLLAGLAERCPEEIGAAVVHNDFKLDNLVLDPEEPSSVRAVLDWEMATVGDPALDLATTLGYWVEAGDPEELQPWRSGPTHLPGMPTRRELVDGYREATGRELPDPAFLYAFGLFKVAVIAQQIYVRWRRGRTKDPRFGALGQAARVLVRRAEAALDVV